MTIPLPANLYTQGFGSKPENVEIPWYSLASPTSKNVNFPLGKRWITATSEYVLTSFSSSGGSLSATWTSLTSPQSISIADAGLSDPLAPAGGGISAIQVTSPDATINSIIIYSISTPGGTVGTTSILRSAGAFVIESTSATDTSTFFYAVINI